MKKTLSIILVILTIIGCMGTFGVSAAVEEITYTSINKTFSGTVGSRTQTVYNYNLPSNVSYQFTFKYTGSSYPLLGIHMYKVEEDETETAVLDKQIMFDETKVVSYKLSLKAGIYRVVIDNTVDLVPVSCPFTIKVARYTSKPNDINIGSASATLKYKKTRTLVPYDEKGNLIYTSFVTFTSNNTNVATVSKTGVITAKGQGRARIFAKIANGTKKYILITVPTLTLRQKLDTNSISTNLDYVYTGAKNSIVGLVVNNKTSKTIKRVYVDFAEYNKKGSRIKGTYDNYYTLQSLKPKSTMIYDFKLQSTCYKARSCIKYVNFTNGTKWTNPYYKTWKATYKK